MTGFFALITNVFDAISRGHKLVLSGLLLICTTLGTAADVPSAPVLLDGAAPAPAPTPIAPAPVQGADGDEVLRPYLRGNEVHGWQRGQLGKPTEFWNQRVDEAPVDPTSAAVIEYLGYVSRSDKSDPSSEFFAQFDLGKKAFNENYSHNVLEADNSTPLYSFEPRLKSLGYDYDEFYTPHCDRILMPVPEGGRLQNEADYECTTNGDCHLYVVNSQNGKVYEQWRAHNPGPDPSQYNGGCANYWDLSVEQPKDLRGLSCTSANAAGIPYVPLLVSPGEIKEGVIRHALAFTMPNGWVERDVYARPATHNPLFSAGWGSAEAGPGQPMLYGSRFRLRKSFEIKPEWPGAIKVILQALKDYGMLHIDGGPRMIILSNDSQSPFGWTDPDINLNPFDLTGKAGLAWQDFELVSDSSDIGSMVDTKCSRTPINEF